MMFYSTGTSPSQMPMLIYLFTYLLKYLFIKFNTYFTIYKDLNYFCSYNIMCMYTLWLREKIHTLYLVSLSFFFIH